MASHVLENLFLFGLNLLLIRRYGTANHGQFVYYVSMLALARLIPDLGLNAATTRLLARGRDGVGRVIGSSLGLAAAVNLPLLALIAWDPFPARAGDLGLGRYFGMWLIAMVAYNAAVSIFNGLQRMDLSLRVSLLLQASLAGLVAWLLLRPPAFGTFIKGANLVMLGMGAATTVLLMLATRAHAPLRPDRGISGALLKQGAVLWVSTTGITLFPQAVNVLINRALSGSSTSHFATLASWSMIGTMALVPMSTAFFAWASRVHNPGPADRGAAPADRGAGPAAEGSAHDAYFRAVGIAAFASAMAIWAASGIILGCYGPEFAPLQGLFGLLLLAQLAEYPRFFTVPLMIGGEHARASFWIESLRMAAGLASIGIAIRLGHGLAGAALALLLVQMSSTMVRLAYVRARFRLDLLPGFAKVGAASLPALLAHSLGLPPASGALGSLAVLALLGGFRPADLAFFRRAIPGGARG